MGGRPIAQSPGPVYQVIEFFGLSGSGKTTLAEQLVARFRNTGLRIYVQNDLPTSGLRDRTWMWTMRLLLPNLVRIAVIYFYIIRHLGVGVMYSARSRAYPPQLIAYWLHCKLCLSAFQADLMVLDQWIISAIYGARFPTGVSKVKNVLILAQRLYAGVRVAYVFVDTDPAVASERLERRAAVAGRPQRLDVPERRRVLGLGKAFFQSVYEEMVRSSLPILRIDGHTPTEEQLERLDAWLGLGQEDDLGAQERAAQRGHMREATQVARI